MPIKEIRSRRSIRKYKPKLIPDKVLNSILEDAIYAPSHCNTQGTRFIIITDNKIKQELIDNGASIIIKNSEQGILVLYKNESDNTEYSDHIQSASASIQNLCLSAEEKGIGTCWICHLPHKKVIRKILNIPDFYDIVAYVMIGYPKNKPTEIKRKFEIKQIISKNKFTLKEHHNNKTGEKILRKIYYKLPLGIKKKLNKSIDKKFVKKFKN